MPKRTPDPVSRRVSRGKGAARLRRIFQTLWESYGPQGWWPAETPFEVMVGAVLTQNTAWGNVERAIANLRAAGKLEPAGLLATRPARLAALLRPSGYFRVKARRLRSFCSWYQARGGLEALSGLDTDHLRQDLLSVPGIGPETADDILLYAFRRPVFVVDAYTRRLFARLGIAPETEGYEDLRHRVQGALGPDVRGFNEFHALIVRHAKQVCRKRPLCGDCSLARGCSTYRNEVRRKSRLSR